MLPLDRIDWTRLKAVFDDAPVIAFARDRDGRYLYVNRAFERLIAKRAADVIGRTVDEVLPADAAGIVRDSDRRALESGEAVVFDNVGLFDGERRSFMNFKVPLADAGGRAWAVLGIGTDVSARRRTQEALERAALAVSSAESGNVFQELTRFLATILEVDVALVGRLEPGEPRLVRTLGVWGGGAYRENFEYPLDVTPCRDVVGRAFHAVPEGVAARYPDDPLLVQFGYQGYAGYPLNDAQGRPVGVIAVLARRPLGEADLIEPVLKIFAVRAAAEIERREALDDLRAREGQYRAIFEGTTDSMVLRDAGFRVVDVNPAYERMSGRPRAEALGMTGLTMSPPELNEQVKALHARALAGEIVQFESLAARKTGERFDLEVHGVPLKYQGRPHVLYIGRDITARKRAEREREELEAQLRQAQKMEAIGHLTGGIAHDFNNILTGIMGYLTLAGERAAQHADPRLERHLEQARSGAQRARDLIQQMLTFSRARRGKPQPVAPGPLVTEAVGLLRSTLPATLELATELERGLPQVMIDPVQLEQVLLNLCINARDAMSGTGTIRVRARRATAGGAACASCRERLAGDWLEVAVADQGSGIAPEVMERMFEPFYSTKEVGRGSGMGLASVHGIVHQHGGHVAVESSPGRGATFRVLLPPLAAAPQAEPAAAGAAGPRAGGALAGRVLLVDDERMVAEFMAELLQGWGLKVKVKHDPLAAEEWFARNAERVHAVILDQTMPKMTGLELARRLAARRPGLPVMLYTGYSDGLEPKMLAAAGVAHLIRKPVEPAELRAGLERMLGAAPAPAPAAAPRRARARRRK